MKLARDKLVIYFGFWLAVIILASVGVATYLSTLRLVDTSGRVKQTHEVFEGLQGVSSLMQALESSGREYLLTGDEQYRQGYAASGERIHRAVSQLDELVQNRPSQAGNLNWLSSLIDRRLSIIDQMMRLRRDGKTDQALVSLRADQEDRSLAQIRSIITDMQHVETEQLLRRDEELKTRAQVAVGTFLGGGLVSLVVLLWIFLFLNRQITARTLAEAALAHERSLLEERVHQRTAELAQAGEALRESSEFNKQIIHSAREGIIVYDDQLRHIVWNAFMEELTGLPVAHVLGKAFFELSPFLHDQGVDALLKRALAGENVGSRDIHYTVPETHKAGWVAGHYGPLRNAQGEIIGVIAMVRDTTKRKEAEDRLHHLSGQLINLQDEERRRIARELHDVTAQNLSAVTLNLARLQTLVAASGNKAGDIAAESIELAEQCLREIRTLSYLLHPPMLDETGLVSALRWYVDGFAKRSGVRVDLTASPGLERLPGEVETALFRIVQESLTNVHRHSGNSSAMIHLSKMLDTLTLEVQDNGAGIRPSSDDDGAASVAALGVGILGMRERVRQLGGRLDIQSNAHGTTVRASLPLQNAEP